MKNKDIKKIVAVGITTSMILGIVPENTIVASAQEVQANYDVNLQNVENKKELYISDIPYIKEQSNVGYGSIMKDKNTDGKLIQLKVDGEDVQFNKGMGCHATSTLVYDLSKYVDKYTRFVSYVGLDSRQGDRGDGIHFTISTSKDGVNWDVVKDLGIVKGNQESKYVDIKLNGAKFIKLYAHENQGKGNDHAVYGDAKLVTDEYSLGGIKINNLSTVAEYDAKLSAETVDYNMQNNQMTILRRAFVNRIGYESIQRMAGKSADYAKGIDYLLNNEVALKYFITGGPVNVNGSYQKSLKYFCDIYAKYKSQLEDKADDNFNLRLAVSISLAFGRDEIVGFWEKSAKPTDSAKRYEIFQKLISDGLMNKGGAQDDFGKWTSDDFKKLPIPMMRWAVDTRMNDDEILWLVDYSLSEKEKGKNFLDAYNYIEYGFGYNYDNPELYKKENFEKYNNKYKFSKYYNDYGKTDVHRLWMVFEEGSVCGGLAQTYSVLSEVFGRPSSPCGQPGHAASITYGWHKENQRYEWMLQNDVYGWAQTGNQFDDRMLNWGNGDWSKIRWDNANYTILATDAVLDTKDYEKATILNLLADSYKDNKTKREAYKKALETQGINIDSITGLIKTYKDDTDIKEETYFELSKYIISTFTYYPEPMINLLNMIKGNIIDKNHEAQLDLLIHEALTKASKATPNETSSVPACKQVADFFLGKASNELATFAFDGKDANKIVINPKYEGSSIRVKYSLDGGTNWTESDEKVITLNEEQLNSITNEKDILVGLVGATTTYTIDILPGDKIDKSSIYANDLENMLIGNLDNLEFSLDNGKTWCDYIVDKSNGDIEVDSEGCIRFKGDKTVKVRRKAHGRHLKSNEFDYKFTEDTVNDKRKYVQIKNLEVTEYSSQNSETHSAKHLIDGTPNTNWHTTFGKREENKFYTIKLDKVRYITSLEYLSLGHNGKMKNGKILTSFDGKTWTESGRFENLANNHELKVIELKQPTACKYIKIVADNTYGNTTGEYDMYFTGNMLNIYEDSTKQYESNVIIEYSNKNITKDNVTATIKLPEGCTIIGEDKHIFTDNGTHDFKYIDIDGQQKTIEAKVDWIDKIAPTATIEYSTEKPTNGDVTVTLKNISSDAKVKNNDGKATYTFTNNGSFEFILEDKAGNITKVPVAVNWIDKEGPIVNVDYSTEKKTNKDVIVTISGLQEGEYVENNKGKTSYTFKENGVFEFIIKDKAGNVTKVPVAVNWIDKVAPTATIVYDVDSWTNGEVVAKLSNVSEEVTILNEGLDYHTFKDNGTYKFEFKDEAGNIGVAEAKVTWIDKTKPETVVKVEDIKTENGSAVKVSLNVDLNEVEILNNNGSAVYTFDKNGTFVFKMRLKKTGYEFEVPVTIDSIKEESTEEPEVKPDVKPEVKPEIKPELKPDNNGSNSGDSLDKPGNGINPDNNIGNDTSNNGGSVTKPNNEGNTSNNGSGVSKPVTPNKPNTNIEDNNVGNILVGGNNNSNIDSNIGNSQNHIANSNDTTSNELIVEDEVVEGLIVDNSVENNIEENKENSVELEKEEDTESDTSENKDVTNVVTISIVAILLAITIWIRKKLLKK